MNIVDIILIMFPVTIVFTIITAILYGRDRTWAKRAGCEPNSGLRILLIIGITLCVVYVLGFTALMLLMMSGMAGM